MAYNTCNLDTSKPTVGIMSKTNKASLQENSDGRFSQQSIAVGATQDSVDLAEARCILTPVGETRSAKRTPSPNQVGPASACTSPHIHTLPLPQRSSIGSKARHSPSPPLDASSFNTCVIVVDKGQEFNAGIVTDANEIAIGKDDNADVTPLDNTVTETDDKSNTITAPAVEKTEVPASGVMVVERPRTPMHLVKRLTPKLLTSQVGSVDERDEEGAELMYQMVESSGKIQSEENIEDKNENVPIFDLGEDNNVEPEGTNDLNGEVEMKGERNTSNMMKSIKTSPAQLEHLDQEEQEAHDNFEFTQDHPRFKRTATMVSNAVIAVSDRPGFGHGRSLVDFRKKASLLGKTVVGLKGKGMEAHSEHMTTLYSCKLYEVLKPLFVIMKISGLFFVRPQGEALFKRNGLCKHVTFAQIYCIIVCVILSLNFLRSIFFSFESGETFGYAVFFKLLWCTFWYECAARSLFANIMWWRKKDGLQALIIKIENECYPDGIIPYESSLKKTVYWLLAGAAFGSFSVIASFAYGFYGPDNFQVLFGTVLLPVKRDFKYIDIYKGILLTIIAITCIIAAVSLAFYTLICFILYKEFEYFCRTFSLKVGPDGEFDDDLQRYRITHQKKSKLVEQADGCFKYYIANTYTANSPLVCLLAYNLLDTQQDISYRMMGMFWVVVVLLQTVIVSVSAIGLNTQAHSPLSTVHSIRTAGSSQEMQIEVSMFLNKLTATDIGLTAWDMFVINKPTMLTIAGMILTYFFLLVQFRNPLQSEDELSTDCHCSLLDSLGRNVTNQYVLQ